MNLFGKNPLHLFKTSDFHQIQTTQYFFQLRSGTSYQVIRSSYCTSRVEQFRADRMQQAEDDEGRRTLRLRWWYTCYMCVAWRDYNFHLVVQYCVIQWELLFLDNTVYTYTAWNNELVSAPWWKICVPKKKNKQTNQKQHRSWKIWYLWVLVEIF